MVSADDKLDALRRLGRAEINVYDDGSVSLYNLREPFVESFGRDWDDCLERLVRRQRKRK